VVVKPPNVPSSFDLNETVEDAGEVPQPEVARTWGQWYKTSPFVPTFCCIFLCFILKVVQQASLHQPRWGAND
jgi:hypothetical protein